MSFREPNGACVLICPKGMEYGTISQQTWNNLNASNEGEVLQVSPDIWANWFSNIKEATVQVNQRVETLSPFSVDEDSWSDTIGQWRAETYIPIALNGSNFPYPINYWLNDNLYCASPVIDGGPSELAQYLMYKKTSGGTSLVSYIIPPGLFIWQGNFYAMVRHYIGSGYGGTRNISISKDKIVSTHTRLDADKHYFTTATVTITQTYY